MPELGQSLPKRGVRATSAFHLIATNRGRTDTSEKCHFRTHAPQHTISTIQSPRRPSRATAAEW